MYWKKKGKERERGRVQGGGKKGTVQRDKEEEKWQGWERGSIKIWGRGKKRRECEVSKDRVFLSFLVLNKNGIKVTEEL